MSFLLSFILVKAVCLQLQTGHLSMPIILAIIALQITSIILMFKAPKLQRWYMVLFSAISILPHIA